MLADCLEVFKKQLEEKGDSLILDSYLPADGTYVLADLSKGGEIVEQGILKWDKKKKELAGKEQFQFYDEMVFFDYNSRLVDMNKPMDSKKIIHSNNYLSFFIKKDSIVNGKLTKEVIDNFYTILENPIGKYQKSKKTMEIYGQAEKIYGTVNKEQLNQCRKWIEAHVFSLEKLAIPMQGKDYLKIFFLFSEPEEMKKEYLREGNRYLLPNIFNSNDYNQALHGLVYGLPNNNMGMNAKKPYLEHKTRGNPMPYLLDADEVIVQKRFFDYLMNFAAKGDVNIYIDPDECEFFASAQDKMPERDFQGIYLRIKKGKEVEIHDMDVVNDYRFRLRKKFIYRDYLGIDFTKLENNLSWYGREIVTLEKMQQMVNEIAFSKFLTGNYFTKEDELSIPDSVLKNVIADSRSALFAWFYKGAENNVMEILKSSLRRLIFGAVENGYLTKAKHILNLYYSVEEHEKKGEEDMKLTPEQVKARLREKLVSEETVGFADDKEYYFGVGQVLYFFLSKSRMAKKNLSLANPLFCAKSDEVIKKKLRQMFIKYNYDIILNTKRFHNLYSMISIYKPDHAVDQDMMIAGFLCDNLLYEKKESDQKKKTDQKEND